MTTSIPSARFLAVLAAIDRKNAEDPRQEAVGGTMRSREAVYAERMSECLLRLYPAASEELRIAARAQHICRWQIARDGFALGREGYNAWRAACRDHHAALITEIMRDHGNGDPEIARVVRLIRKQDLKRDPESQALENVVAAVFVEHYLGAFIEDHSDYGEAKLVGILRKTMRKMDAAGHAAVMTLDLPPSIRQLIAIAMNGG